MLSRTTAGLPRFDFAAQKDRGGCIGLTQAMMTMPRQLWSNRWRQRLQLTYTNGRRAVGRPHPMLPRENQAESTEDLSLDFFTKARHLQFELEVPRKGTRHPDIKLSLPWGAFRISPVT